MKKREEWSFEMVEHYHIGRKIRIAIWNDRTLPHSQIRMIEHYHIGSLE